LVKLGIWIVPVNNVGLLVDFRLGNKSLLAFVRGLVSLSLVMSAWVILTPVPTTGNRGNLLGPWVIGQVVCVLEFHISVLNKVTVSEIGTVSIAWHLHSIERGVPDSLLEPEGLEILSERRNPVLLEVCMLVMLLNMKIRVLVKIEVLAVSLIPEGLQLGHNGAPGQHNTLSTKEKSVQGPICCCPFLILLNFFTWLHQLNFPQQARRTLWTVTILARKLGLKGPSLSRVSRVAESWEGSSQCVQYGGPTAKLIIDWDIRAPWLAKRRGVFSLVINTRIIGSLQVGMWDITEGMSSYSPHLAKKNKHVGESLSCRMWTKGHGRGLRRLGVEKVILKGFLVSQGLNLIISCTGPVIDSSWGPPHVPCPKCKKLEASHRKLGDLVSWSVPFRLPYGTAELLNSLSAKSVPAGEKLIATYSIST
jgi:hypothetical protein